MKAASHSRNTIVQSHDGALSALMSLEEVLLARVTPEYWRVTFHNPPFNIFGPESSGQLNEAITAIERDPKLKVVVFDSDVPNFFLTHYDKDAGGRREAEAIWIFGLKLSAQF